MGDHDKKPPLYGNFKKPKGKKKHKKKEDSRPGMSKTHRDNIRSLPCCACGNSARSYIHHLLSTDERGSGLTSTDKWGLPMCEACHIYGVHDPKVGSRGEMKWFADRGIDCLVLAAAFWSVRHSLDAMQNVWITHWDLKPKTSNREVAHANSQ